MLLLEGIQWGGAGFVVGRCKYVSLRGIHFLLVDEGTGEAGSRSRMRCSPLFPPRLWGVLFKPLWVRVSVIWGPCEGEFGQFLDVRYSTDFTPRRQHDCPSLVRNADNASHQNWILEAHGCKNELSMWLLLFFRRYIELSSHFVCIFAWIGMKRVHLRVFPPDLSRLY